MCMCRISPFFRRNRPAFPSFSLYWIDFWALPLYWYWFQRLPNKLPKLVFRRPHGISRSSHVLARAFSLFHVGKCVTCAPLQPILSMMCVCVRRGCLLVDFSRLSKNRLNPKRAFLYSSRVWQFLNVFDIVFGVIFSKKWNSFWRFVRFAKERIFKASPSVRFSELGPLRVNFQLV